MTPSEVLTEYISALDFTVAMRLGLAHFEDKELESFSCEEIDTKTLHMRLVTAVLNDSENESDNDKPSEVLKIGTTLIQEINNLKSKLTTMKENSDCAHDNADEDFKTIRHKDIYELGYADGTNGFNARDTINPRLQYDYDCGYVDGESDARSEWY